MKFRLKCAGCSATFFSPDRRARYCPKCAKKRPASEPAAKPLAGRKPAPAAPKPPEPPKPAPPKRATELTPELRERIVQLYCERYAERQFVRREAIKQMGQELLVKNQLVSRAVHDYETQRQKPSPEILAQVVAQYLGYVERNERPEGGRRRTIARQFNLRYEDVRQATFAALREKAAHFEEVGITREQLFAVEKLYFAELEHARHRLPELPARIAEQLGFVTPWQVHRWLDQLHNDESAAQRIPAVTPEQEAQIVEAYRAYLTAAAPPELSLHATLAQQIGELTNQQVYKVLLAWRWQQRRAYPWQ
jgi:transposase-like protein